MGPLLKWGSNLLNTASSLQNFQEPGEYHCAQRGCKIGSSWRHTDSFIVLERKPPKSTFLLLILDNAIPISPEFSLVTTRVKVQKATEASPLVFRMLEVYQFLNHSQADIGKDYWLCLDTPKPHIMCGSEQSNSKFHFQS